MLAKYEGSLRAVAVVSRILDGYLQQKKFAISLEQLASRHKVTTRTLQRYFEKCTGINTKQALQVIRIRKAIEHLSHSPGDFHYSFYGYFDYSHFYKHLKAFLGNRIPMARLRPSVDFSKGQAPEITVPFVETLPQVPPSQVIT